ncbi:MAG: DUF1850 domain-containing protein [Rhodobacteraceae bacterium]|nr:MAG: DUF1850 domain-containing protein [Paracoccaceae bacterium]
MTAALALCAAPLCADPVVEVTLETGQVLAQWPLGTGAELCLHWSHSVTGGAVADCFIQQAGQFMLMRSYLHDGAAGLGEIPGRGQMVAAPEGGYWIERMAEPLADNRLTLRIGSSSVGHRLTLEAAQLDLSALAPGARATLTLKPE